MNKIIVFAATYNEAQNVEKLINQILKVSSDTDILIIDDNSEDKTFEIIEKSYNKNHRITLIKRERKLGLDTAHKMAFKFAKNNNYKKLITMDADLSHDPNEIPKFIRYLNQYDFVIGSRYAPKGLCEMTFLRKILSIVGNKLIKFVLKTNLTEYTTSYRGFNLENLKNFDLELVKSKGYSFFMDTINVLNESKINMYEFPITFKNRIIGKSKIPKLEIFRTLIRLFVIFLTKRKIIN
jgi:dolichol-phosphate mannosyltransferase